MIGFFRRVQERERSLIIRGSFSEEILRYVVDRLDPAGLFLLIMIEDASDLESLRAIVGM